MAVYNISEDEQEKIAQKLKEFMEDEGIQGEIQITFTKDYEVDVNPSAVLSGCWRETPDGSMIFQNPCTL